jgi:hypothetical protein
MNKPIFAAMAAILLASAFAAPASAQAATAAPSAQAAAPAPILGALKRHFPAEHAELSASLAGKPAAETRRLVYRAMLQFQRNHADEILGAPDKTLLALEATQARLLEAIAARDTGLCAKLGDRGFWGAEAQAAAPPPGIEKYGAELIEAAAAGQDKAGAGDPDVKDLNAWIAGAERLAPGVQVERMLTDAQARAAASPQQLCTAMIALHKAVAGLPVEQGARISAMMLGSLLMMEP